MFYLILALVDPGDEVLYPNPGFPIYESMIRFIGGVPVPVRLLEEKGHALDVDQLISKITPKTRLIVLNYPHNPTGGIIPEAGLRAIADAAVQHGIPVLSDEIYSQILYDGKHVSIAAMPGMESLAIVLDGFSKTYAMTGWRLGYGIMPAPLAQVLAKLQTNAISCTATFTQLAGVQALKGDHAPIDAMVAEFRKRRDAIVEGLRLIPGFKCARPQGAFYVFPNITGTGYGAKALADRLLDEAGVACLSGTAFGEWGEGHLRFSYAEQPREHPGSAAPDQDLPREVARAGPAQARPTAFARIQSWPTARWTKFLKKAGEFFSYTQCPTPCRIQPKTKRPSAAHGGMKRPAASSTA